MIALSVAWLAADKRPCSDIFALPSESEGIPAALVEAMATGLPSVVSDIPGEAGSKSVMPG
jgi:glycosyltransferase involved in cell wall biosynthesis